MAELLECQDDSASDCNGDQALLFAPTCNYLPGEARDFITSPLIL